MSPPSETIAEVHHFVSPAHSVAVGEHLPWLADDTGSQEALDGAHQKQTSGLAPSPACLKRLRAGLN